MIKTRCRASLLLRRVQRAESDRELLKILEPSIFNVDHFYVLYPHTEL